MLKFLFFLALLNNVQNLRSCRWVCIDKNNNIKKEFLKSSKFNVDYQNDQEITISPQREIIKNKNKVTLKHPEMWVHPTNDMCQAKESFKTIKEMARKIKCRPRDTIVSIKYRGKRVIPNKVSTKLCSGFCPGSKFCVSAESKNISVTVSIADSKNIFQCSVVSIIQDVKCKCGCDKKHISCSSRQSFDKKFCKCKCINEDEYKLCIAKSGNDLNKYYWNKNECLCKCTNEYICSSGSNWDHDQCKCVRSSKQ